MLRVIELQCHVHILAKHVPGWRTAASSLGINTKHVTGYSTAASFVGLARTIFIRCICGIFCREATKYTVIYGVYKRFWPTLVICMAKHSMRSVLLHLYTWHVRSVLLHTLYLTREISSTAHSIPDTWDQFYCTLYTWHVRGVLHSQILVMEATSAVWPHTELS
jgi:hypothetical protein